MTIHDSSQDRDEIPFARIVTPEQMYIAAIERELLEAGLTPDPGPITADPEFQIAPPPPPPLAQLFESAAVALCRCPSCWKTLAGLPPVARFCPKCGAALPVLPAAHPGAAGPLHPMYARLRDDLDAKLAAQPSDQASRMMVLAYASSLVNLGWRYENGRGELRNVAEAARCYTKADRLAHPVPPV